MSVLQRQMANLQPRLTGSEMDKLADKEGPRRTIYYTKKLPGNAGYRRTGQYLGEWHENKWSGKAEAKGIERRFKHGGAEEREDSMRT